MNKKIKVGDSMRLLICLSKGGGGGRAGEVELTIWLLLNDTVCARM